MNETMPWKNATISTLEESLLLMYNNMQVLFQNFGRISFEKMQLMYCFNDVFNWIA
jgi:hypothetical protein